VVVVTQGRLTVKAAQAVVVTHSQAALRLKMETPIQAVVVVVLEALGLFKELAAQVSSSLKSPIP
jgi:hypothetical protein